MPAASRRPRPSPSSFRTSTRRPTTSSFRRPASPRIPSREPSSGTSTATEPDAGDTNTFTLLDDAGGRFSIIDNKLVVANGSLLDYESATSHSIQVKVTDAGGKFSTKTITIGVSDVNEGTAAVAQATSSAPDAGASPDALRDPSSALEFQADGSLPHATFFAELAQVLGTIAERTSSGDRFDFRALLDTVRDLHDQAGDHFAGATLDLGGGQMEDGVTFSPCTLTPMDDTTVISFDEGFLRSLVEPHKTVAGDFLV